MTSLCPVYEFLAGKMEGPVEDVRYKQLYHASMERCESLQQLVGKYSQLLPKHKRVIELKVGTLYLVYIRVHYTILLQNKVISNLSKNKGLVDSYHECLGLREAELQQQIENWHSKEKKCEQVSLMSGTHYSFVSEGLVFRSMGNFSWSVKQRRWSVKS